MGSIDVSLSDLESDLVDETNARVSADNILSDRITTEATRNDTQDGEIDDLDIRVDTLENNVQLKITYDSDLSELGNPGPLTPEPGRFIPFTNTDIVTDEWQDVSVISFNTLDTGNV